MIKQNIMQCRKGFENINIFNARYSICMHISKGGSAPVHRARAPGSKIPGSATDKTTIFEKE